MDRLIKNNILISLFYEHNFDSVFNNNERLFLSWTYSESGHDQFTVRYEPGYKYFNIDKYTDFIEKISLGLFQMMGANLFTLGLAEQHIEDYLKDLNAQYKLARAFLKKCPSSDIYSNLAWWNTGSTDQNSPAAQKYINKIILNTRLFADFRDK